MCPRVVVLRVFFEHRLAESQFAVSVAQPLHHGAAVVPDLVVLGVLSAEAIQIVKLFVQVQVHLLQAVSSVQPVTLASEWER